MFEKPKKSIKDLFELGPIVPKSFKKEDRKDFIDESNRATSVAMKKALIAGGIMVGAAFFINYSAEKEINQEIYLLTPICIIWIAFFYHRTFR